NVAGPWERRPAILAPGEIDFTPNFPSLLHFRARHVGRFHVPDPAARWMISLLPLLRMSFMASRRVRTARFGRSWRGRMTASATRRCKMARAASMDPLGGQVKEVGLPQTDSADARWPSLRWWGRFRLAEEPAQLPCSGCDASKTPQQARMRSGTLFARTFL